MNLEVQVRDAELGVASLTEEADDGTGRDGTEFAVAVEVGVVVLVAVHAAEPDGGATEHVGLRFGDAVDDSQHGNAALTDHVDALVPATAAARSTPGIRKRSGSGSGGTRPAGPGAVVVATAGEVAVSAAAGLPAAGVGQRRPGRCTRRRARIASGVAAVVVGGSGVGSGWVAGEIDRRRSRGRWRAEQLLAVGLAQAPGVLGDQRGADCFVFQAVGFDVFQPLDLRQRSVFQGRKVGALLFCLSLLVHELGAL